MADTPNNGETVNQGDSQTTVPTPATPVVNADDQAEVERLRKEAEQAKMRANQLENDLKKVREAEDEARQKQLKENEEWKTIAEQNEAKLKALQEEADERDRKAELAREEATVLGEFPKEVTELAKEVGVSLEDTSDEGKEKLRSTLTKLKERVASEATPTPNNPGQVTATPEGRQEVLQEYIQTGSPQVLDKALQSLNWVQGAKAINGD